MRRPKFVAAFAALAAMIAGSLIYAARSTPTNTYFLDPSVGGASAATGVFDDGTATYSNGVGGVQSYFGVNLQNSNLVTYNTNPMRTLRFVFDPNATAWKNSGLPGTSNATVDFYGVNYYGQYTAMRIGTTAQVNATLQFKVSGTGSTYQLAYPSLAAFRESQTTWLMTSDPNDIILPQGYPGFTASDSATLGVFRKRTLTNFGTVEMPIRFEVALQ